MGMESVGLHGPAQPVTFSAVPVQAGPLFPYSFLAGICSGSIKEEALTKVAVVIWDDEVHCNKVLEVVWPRARPASYHIVIGHFFWAPREAVKPWSIKDN